MIDYYVLDKVLAKVEKCQKLAEEIKYFLCATVVYDLGVLAHFGTKNLCMKTSYNSKIFFML